MKKYIVLRSESNMLIFDYRYITKEENVFVNKNINKDNLFYYDLRYFKKHFTSILSKYNSSILRIDTLITFKYAFDIIKCLSINTLVLNFNSSLDLSDYELFLNCDSLKCIYCYYMPKVYLNMFYEKGIDVNVKFKDNISKKFLELQNVTDIDELYYKKVITFNEEYDELLDDTITFLRINYKLKGIHLCIYSKNIIRAIVGLVKNDESRNVVVFLHQEYDDSNFIINNYRWLKDLSEKCRKEYTCDFKIIYSRSFVNNNFFKQLSFNNVKMIFMICFYFSLVCLIIYGSYRYVEKMSIASLNSELSNNQEDYDDDEYEYGVEDEEEDIVSDDENVIESNTKKDNDKYKFENSFKKLKGINNDTVGYLIVNNTDISYPVVQTSDNNYYLQYDFYKKKKSIGWIYMDYRNNVDDLDDNTIIFGHNMSNGTMFGSLKKVLDSSFVDDENNLFITFDTENAHYKFRIFSTYKLDYTTDYLVTSFNNSNDKKEFVKLIMGRSGYNYGVNVKVDDKILTLSTCADKNNRRLVVHAVLINE